MARRGERRTFVCLCKKRRSFSDMKCAYLFDFNLVLTVNFRRLNDFLRYRFDQDEAEVPSPPSTLVSVPVDITVASNLFCPSNCRQCACMFCLTWCVLFSSPYF